jgi:hypothetical protein
MLDNVATLPDFALVSKGFVFVVLDQLFGLFFQYSPTLLNEGEPVG